VRGRRGRGRRGLGEPSRERHTNPDVSAYMLSALSYVFAALVYMLAVLHDCAPHFFVHATRTCHANTLCIPRLKEGIDINKGLLVLGNVISKLSEGGGNKGNTHVPFRESKLTRVLRSSLDGNSKTLFIGCVSGDVRDTDETVCCLRYASRVKDIMVETRINETVEESAVKRIEELTRVVGMLARDFLMLKENTGHEGEYGREELRRFVEGDPMAKVRRQ